MLFRGSRDETSNGHLNRLECPVGERVAREPLRYFPTRCRWSRHQKPSSIEILKNLCNTTFVRQRTRQVVDDLVPYQYELLQVRYVGRDPSREQASELVQGARCWYAISLHAKIMNLVEERVESRHHQRDGSNCVRRVMRLRQAVHR